MTYGQCENADLVYKQKLLPIGLAKGCVLTRDIKKDSTLTFHDVEIPDGRLVDQLRTEQNQYFFKEKPE